MIYEWKHKIELDLIFLDKNMPTGIYKYKEKRAELDEVYCKADAWDKLQEILEGEIIEANPVYNNDGTKKAEAPINIKIEAWESVLMSMEDLIGSLKSKEADQ